MMSNGYLKSIIKKINQLKINFYKKKEEPKNNIKKEFLKALSEPELSIPLKNYFNNPENNNDQYFVGRKAELDKLVDLLERNRGGSYLVSGYRGVGKTRFVNHALQKYKIDKNKKTKEKIIEVRINLGSDSKLSSRTVLTDIVSLFKEVLEDKLKKKLFYFSKSNSIPVSNFKILSVLFISSIFYYIATHDNFSNANSDYVAVLKMLSLSASWLSVIALIISASGSVLRRIYSSFIIPLSDLEDLQKAIYLSSENNVSVGNQTIGSIGRKEFSSVLDNNQIESKLIKIFTDITKTGVKGLKVVIIFDELDKLTGKVTEKTEGNIDLIKESKLRKSQIDSLLGDLKNFITASKITYIFIAGRDMYDAYLSERGSANSLYESLFNDHIYIPSLLTDRSDEEVYVLDSMIEAFVVSNLITKDQLEKISEKEVQKEFTINYYLQDLKLSNYGRLLKCEGVIFKRLVENLFSEDAKRKRNFKSNIEKFISISREFKDSEIALAEFNNNLELQQASEKYAELKIKNDKNSAQVREIIKAIDPESKFVCYPKFLSVLEEEENERIKEIHNLKTLIHFLALHSWGNYKRLITLFESFIKLDPNQESNKYKLYFSTKDTQRLVLASHLYIMFHHNLSRMLINADDKLVVSSFSVFLHAMKYHGIGFSRENILRMYETINIHSSPELIRVVDIILNNVLSNHVRIIRRSGIYQYRFSYLHEREIHFITNINEDESAAFNFSLNAMDAVKQHYRNLIVDSKYTHADEGYGHIALASIHIIVGDFHFWEQAYDEASIHYGMASDILERNFVTKLDNTTSENKNTIILQLIEIYLKQGSVAERIGNYGKAESIYNEAIRKSDEYFLKIRKEDREENPEWGILLQPRWAKNYLQLKHSSFNYVSAKLIPTNSSKYKEAVLLLFMGKFSQAHSGFMQVCSDMSRQDPQSYFLLGNSYLRASFSLFLNFSSKLHKKIINLNFTHDQQETLDQHETLLESTIISLDKAITGFKEIADGYRNDQQQNNTVELEKFEKEVLDKQRSKINHSNNFFYPENEEEEIKHAFGLLRLATFYFIKGRLNLDAAISALSTVMMWEVFIEMLPWQKIRNPENPDEKSSENPDKLNHIIELLLRHQVRNQNKSNENRAEINLRKLISVDVEKNLKNLEKNIKEIREREPLENIILASQEQAFTSIAYNTGNAFSHFMKTSLHRNLDQQLPNTLFGKHETMRELILDDGYFDGHGLYQQYSIFGQVAVASIYWEEIAYKRFKNSSISEMGNLRLGNLRNGYLLPYGIRYYTTLLWLRGRLFLDDLLNSKFNYCKIYVKNSLNNEEVTELENKLISTAMNALILFFRSSQYVIKTHGDASGMGIPPLHIIYYNMWEVLFRLLSLYKENNVESFDYTKGTLHLRDILDEDLKQRECIKDISSRIFDISHIKVIALEQFKIVERIGNQESMNRINIMRNKYYLDDDFEDNMFNLDWTYCHFFAPGALIYRTIIKDGMDKIKELKEPKVILEETVISGRMKSNDIAK